MKYPGWGNDQFNMRFDKVQHPGQAMVPANIVMEAIIKIMQGTKYYILYIIYY